MRLSPRLRPVLSGEAQGPAAQLVRLGLSLVRAGVYERLINLRNRGYERGWLTSVKLPVPVISVGNITVGGTGKTPFVVWLCRQLCARNLKVAILSRGYKSGKGWRPGSAKALRRGKLEARLGNGPSPWQAEGRRKDKKNENDEMKLLGEALPEVAIIADPDRVRGGRRAIEEFGAQVLVLDDGFQHRRLRRDLDLVLVDCSNPWGYGKVLPRGLLREPLRNLARADAVILTRCDQVAAEQVSRIKDQVTKLINSSITPGAKNHLTRPIAESRQAALGLYGADGKNADSGGLAGRRVLAFCGIGNPGAFYETLRQLGAVVIKTIEFPDHYAYSPGVWRELQALRGGLVEALVTTEKDWVKLRDFAGVPADLFWLKVETRITAGEGELIRRIEESL